MNKQALITAVKFALVGDWHKSHNIAQEYSDDVTNNNLANWIHAVLHKIEGDVCNSNYWYARTLGFKNGVKNYNDFSDTTAELNAILNHLNSVEKN